MFRRKVVLVGSGILVFAVLLFLGLRRPEVRFELPDGTSIHCIALKQGKVLRFYEGQFWQRTLFSIGLRDLPARWRSVEIVISPIGTNGGMVLKLGYLRNAGLEQKSFRAHDGTYTMPVNASSRVTLVEPTGEEVIGTLRMVHYDTASSLLPLEPPAVLTEHIYWEFPLSTERELRFRFYHTNSVSLEVSTNEFSMVNPAL